MYGMGSRIGQAVRRARNGRGQQRQQGQPRRSGPTPLPGRVSNSHRQAMNKHVARGPQRSISSAPRSRVGPPKGRPNRAQSRPTTARGNIATAAAQRGIRQRRGNVNSLAMAPLGGSRRPTRTTGSRPSWGMGSSNSYGRRY